MAEVLRPVGETFVASPSQSRGEFHANPMDKSSWRSAELSSAVKPSSSGNDSNVSLHEARNQSAGSTEPSKNLQMINASQVQSIPSRSQVSSGTERANVELIDVFSQKTCNLIVAYLLNNIVQQERLPLPNPNIRDLHEAVAAFYRGKRDLTAVENAVIEVAKVMTAQQGDAIRDLASRIPVDNSLPETYSSIASQVFIHEPSTGSGFTWSRFISLLVFTGRVATQCVQMEASELVWSVALKLTTLVARDLRPQIEQLGGWDSFLEFADEVRERSQAEPPNETGGRFRKLLSHMLNVSTMGFGISVEESESVTMPADAQSRLSKSAWIAPITSALIAVMSRL